LPELLDRRPEHYRRVYSDGRDAVFSFLQTQDPTLALLEVPDLPQGARLISAQGMLVRGFPGREPAAFAIDGEGESRWSTGTPQRRGQYFEVRLPSPRKVVALEIDNPGRVMDVPASFSLRASVGSEPLREVFSRPKVRLYRQQVESPKNFVFRLAFEQPVTLDRLRLTVGQSFAGYYFSIHELRLYER
jgi:hypothetical protein